MKSGTGFLEYLRVLAAAGAHVDWGIIGLLCLVGIVGSFAGKVVNARVRPGALQRGFAVLLVVMAAFILARESATLSRPAVDVAPALSPGGEE